ENERRFKAIFCFGSRKVKYTIVRKLSILQSTQGSPWRCQAKRKRDYRDMTSLTPCHGLYELMDSYDGFIMDQWGVLHNGVKPYEGVVDVLNHLRQHKKQVIILSNSGKRSKDNIERLRKLGLKSTLYKEVVTAGEVAWRGLNAQKEPPF